MPVSLRGRSALKWTAISLATLTVLLLLIAAVLDRNANAFRGAISRIASAHAGRKVSINGQLELHLLSLEPHAIAESLTIGNPDWARARDMARIGRLEVSISLPALFKGEVVL